MSIPRARCWPPARATARSWSGTPGPWSWWRDTRRNADGYRRVRFSPDGRTIAFTRSPGQIRLWDYESGREEVFPMGASAIAFSHDGRLLAAALQKEVVLWDVRQKRKVRALVDEHRESITAVDFSPDDRTLAPAANDKNVVLWDVSRQKPAGPPLVGHEALVNDVKFSPDGKRLVSVDDSGDIVIWDVERRRQDGPVLSRPGPARSVAFDRSGDRMATGHGDDVILWDFTRRLQIGGAFTGHNNMVTSVRFSPDGRTLVSSSFDHTLLRWDVDPASWRRRACQVANRNLTPFEWNRLFPQVELGPPVCQDVGAEAERLPAPAAPATTATTSPPPPTAQEWFTRANFGFALDDFQLSVENLSLIEQPEMNRAGLTRLAERARSVRALLADQPLPGSGRDEAQRLLLALQLVEEKTRRAAACLFTCNAPYSEMGQAFGELGEALQAMEQVTSRS